MPIKANHELTSRIHLQGSWRDVWVTTGLVTILASVIGCVTLAQALDFSLTAPGPTVAAPLFWSAATHWLICICCSPLIAIAAQAFPLQTGRVISSVGVHVVLALLFALIMSWLAPNRAMLSQGDFVVGPIDSSEIPAFILTPPQGAIPPITEFVPKDMPPTPEAMKNAVPLGKNGRMLEGGAVIEVGVLPGNSLLAITATFLSHVFVYLVFSGAAIGLGVYRESQQQSARADRYQRKLAQSQLATLRMQMRPHFLFNTLNGIATLMQRDVEGAERMTHRLSDLLRASLDVMQDEHVELQQEVALLRSYLEIQQIRFDERLQFVIDVPTDLYTALVPAFCLQPLAENAVQHGLERSSENGEIRLTVSLQEEGRVVLEMADNGYGLDSELSLGVGLGNTMKRLDKFYGEDAGIEFVTPESGGFAVRLSLPLEYQ